MLPARFRLTLFAPLTLAVSCDGKSIEINSFFELLWVASLVETKHDFTIHNRRDQGLVGRQALGRARLPTIIKVRTHSAKSSHVTEPHSS
jgi:hypothetical protein